MAHRTVHRLAYLVTLLAVTSSAKKEQSRWSRQISTYTSDISDWVPLPGPVEREPEIMPEIMPQIKRQAVAEPRILTEPFPGLSRPTGFSQDSFQGRPYNFNAPLNRQLYLQSVPSVPSAPQNYLTEQGFGQSIRFGLSQPNFPLSQGFVAPPFGFDTVQPQKSRLPPIPNPVSFSQGLPSPQAKPFYNPSQKTKFEVPRLVDGYRAENVSSDYSFHSKKRPQSLQKIKFEGSIEKPLKSIGHQSQSDPLSHNSKLEREEVQLLYVPLESLNRGQFNLRSPLTTSQLVNTELYSQGVPRPTPVKQAFINEYQRPVPKPLESFSGQNLFSDFNSQLKNDDQVPKYSTNPTPFPTQPPTTPKPKKLKPHQPPLAIFMTKEVSKNSQVKVGDVLSSLKNADTIAVLDSVNPLNAPKVFIGPSTLPPPENFVKFELPYLSNIENSDKKLKQLPFFVAPLSYNTPNGFAKIPFPSPHVGSVVINSQIRDTAHSPTPSQPNYNSNFYAVTAPAQVHTEKPVTQKPTFSYYSTAAPKPHPPVPNYQSNYYSFEPQTVSSIRPPKQPETATAPPKTGSYFLSNAGQYNSQEFANFPPPNNNYKSSELLDQYNFQRKPDRTTTLRTTTTTTTTTKPPSTYPSQLLETHNPYSINQAFHFSTPLDYHNYFDDVKQPFMGPGKDGHSPSPSPPSSQTPSPTPSSSPSPSPSPTPSYPSRAEPQPEQVITEKPKYRQQPNQPNYLQNYTPEIHYDSDPSLKYPVFNHNEYADKTETSSQPQSSSPVNPEVITPPSSYNSDIPAPENNNNNYNNDYNAPVHSYKTEYSPNIEPQSHVELAQQQPNEQENPSDVNDLPTISEIDTPPKYDNDEYNMYQANFDAAEPAPTSSSTTTTTTTTRRTPTRSRGRPRYTTTPRSESYESTTRVVVTRRPLRERKPLPSRPRYEPNKITTEKPSKKSDSSEITTKPSRQRIRGRIHYKPSDNEEIYDKRVKTHNTKEEDLAYQRDVLHQNYPVTLMERASTVDIEAMTEPTLRQPAEKNQDTLTEAIDTENAYTNEKVSISHDFVNTESRDESQLPNFTARSTTINHETSYVPNLPSTRQDYLYQSRSSVAPIESSAYDDTNAEKEEDIYVKQTTPAPKSEYVDISSYASELPSNPATEQSVSYSISNDFGPAKQEDVTMSSENEGAKIESQELPELEEEENVVQTTPSYNRVRVRPGVIRQYHQASTESPKPKERKRPSQPVTYRPAFNGRRTTMRIDEIEADLKTKQVHSRPEVQEIRHPVYRPEPTTESSATSPSTTDTATKRGHFRRRRPSYSYTTTSTESSSTKRVYEVKNRFRGRRPTEKPTEKSAESVQTEAPASTTKSPLHSRYSHRPRLSERYNKKTEIEETEDQDSNYSINRPKYTEPDTDQWSPKISSDSFKPYNPNDIVDEQKIATTERRSDKESELDIITARNEFEDILLTVTPASNNRANKKIPEIPPTLEALVEQSKVTRSDSTDTMSTFESMLEEVMKSLEEQDQDEYSMNVMKHKGGEIGEIPPERIISSGDNYAKSTTPLEEITTVEPTADDSTLNTEDDKDRKARRRGFWKKVNVRPLTTESIEFAESQYYTHTVNRLGQPVKQSKNVHEKTEKSEKPKVTTYKPSYDFIKDLFTNDKEPTEIDVIPTVDIPKLSSKATEKEDETLITEESKQTTVYLEKESQTQTSISPGDFDLGTGSPDPTLDDLYLTTPTEAATTAAAVTVNRSDAGFSFMDYLFGVTSEDETKATDADVQNTTEQPKPKIVTTESAFIPEEITAPSTADDNTETITFDDIKRLNSTEETKTEKPADTTEISVVKVETSSVSSFMNPANVVSTSMSTEVSHETEICFRGKCIKTSKDIL